LLANGRWFSPGTPASSTTKTGRHDKKLFVKLQGKNVGNGLELVLIFGFQTTEII
jgi:hypothetical protein